MAKKTNKYDFNNPESLKLLEEFTTLLGDITKYVEEQAILSKEREEEMSKSLHVLQAKYEQLEMDVINHKKREAELLEKIENMSRGRYMLKTLIKKSYRLVSRIILFLPRKLKGKFKKSSR